jgi:hypothetical protein
LGNITNREGLRTGREEAMTYCHVLSQNSLGRLRKTMEKPEAESSGVWKVKVMFKNKYAVASVSSRLLIFKEGICI